jgi:hypothetical protein
MSFNPEGYVCILEVGVISRNLNAQFFEESNAIFIKPIASELVGAALFGTACVKEPAEINAQPREPARGCEM